MFKSRFELAGSLGASGCDGGWPTQYVRSVNLTSVKPGLLTLSQDGCGTAIAVHQDGITLISPDNPAHPNEMVIFYGTGFEPVTPSLGTGDPSVGNQTVAVPKVTIDGLDAQVLFSGLAGGLVGLNQLNVIVPGLARQNPADPVVVTINNVPSNTVTLPVAP